MSTVGHRIGEGWQLRNVVHAAGYDNDQYLIALGERGDDGHVNRAAYFEDQRYRYAFAELKLEGSARSGPLTHRLVLGADYQRVRGELGYHGGSVDPIRIQNPSRTGAPPADALEATSVSDQTNQTLGLFVQDQIELAGRLRLLAGARFTHLAQTSVDRLSGAGEDRFDESEVTPRLGALYPVRPNLSLYGTYSQSFVPYHGVDRDGNPFRPVRGKQYEAGLKSSLFGERLSATLAAYRLTRSNVVSFVFDSEFGFHSVQGAEHRTWGLELDLLGRLAPGWTVMGSYAYLDGRIVEDPNHEAGRRLSGSPPHSGSLWTSYEPGDRIGVGAGVFFTGKRRTLNSSQVVTPGYTTVDLAVSYRLAGRHQARLNIKNALNRRYYTGAQSYTLVFPGAPRTLQLSLATTF